MSSDKNDKKKISRLKKPQIGKSRIVYFNYADGEKPKDHPPEIILVRPNEVPKIWYNTGFFWENLGVLTLATHLESCGIRFGVLEASLFQCSIDRTVKLSVESSPRFVGISVCSSDILSQCMEIAARIKRLNPEIQIILGGHGIASYQKRALEKHNYIDVVVRGDGETILADLILGGKEKDNIPSIAYRENNQIFLNPLAPPESDLDRLPLPHLFARDIMIQDPVLAKANLMSVSSRGCVFNCKFCSVASFDPGGWRGRSPKHIVNEIEHLVKRYQKKTVSFWDDFFLGPGKKSRQRAIDIAEELIRRKLEITFHITTRTTGLDTELVRILARAGLRSVYLGLENSSQTMLDRVGKHAKAEDGIHAVNLFWKNGVYRILIGYMLFHPWMTWSEYRRNLDVLDSLPNFESSVIFSRLWHYPGTPLWLEEVKKDKKKSNIQGFLRAPLPNAALERLYEISVWLFQRTLGLQDILICLEEQNFENDEMIKYLAACHMRLFHIMSKQTRIIADRLEHGHDEVKDTVRFGEQVMIETLSILEEMETKIHDPYFDWLLKSWKLDKQGRKAYYELINE